MKEHREEQASTVFCGTKGPCAPDAMTMVSTVWPVVRGEKIAGSVHKRPWDDCGIGHGSASIAGKKSDTR